MQKWIQPPASSDHGLHTYWLAHFYLMKKSANVLLYFGLDCGMLGPFPAPEEARRSFKTSSRLEILSATVAEGSTAQQAAPPRAPPARWAQATGSSGCTVASSPRACRPRPLLPEATQPAGPWQDYWVVSAAKNNCFSASISTKLRLAISLLT